MFLVVTLALNFLATLQNNNRHTSARAQKNFPICNMRPLSTRKPPPPTGSTGGSTGSGDIFCEIQPILIKCWYTLFAIMTVCQNVTMSIDAGDQTTKIQNYRCNEDLTNLVSTVILTHSAISQYLYVVLAVYHLRHFDMTRTCWLIFHWDAVYRHVRKPCMPSRLMHSC